MSAGVSGALRLTFFHCYLSAYGPGGLRYGVAFHFYVAHQDTGRRNQMTDGGLSNRRRQVTGNKIAGGPLFGSRL